MEAEGKREGGDGKGKGRGRGGRGKGREGKGPSPPNAETTRRLNLRVMCNKNYLLTYIIFFQMRYHCLGVSLWSQVDILDTAGNLEFPAMRRLSISTAHAFLLVFAVDNQQSFDEVCQLWEQIGELRPNRDEIPCVIAANKVRASRLHLNSR